MASAHKSKQAYEDAGAIHKLAGKYLTFVLDREEFGIEISRVREIVGVIDSTPVPEAPAHSKTKQ